VSARVVGSLRLQFWSAILTVVHGIRPSPLRLNLIAPPAAPPGGLIQINNRSGIVD
jgi:hypothetical protein